MSTENRKQKTENTLWIILVIPLLWILWACPAPSAAQAPGDLSAQGEAALEAGKYAEAADLLGRYLQEHPEAVPARRSRALALTLLGKKAEALAELDQGLTQRPDEVSLLLARARLRVEMNRRGEAIDDYSRILTREPQNVEIWKERATNRAKEGRLTEALQDLDQAARLAPQDAMVFYERGLVNFSLGNFSGAEADLSAALDLDPGLRPARFLRGNLYFLHYRQKDRALADFREGCNQGHPLSCELLATFGGKPDEAKEDREADRLAAQGVSAFEAGRYDEAADLLGKSLQGDPDDTRAALYRALALNSMGQKPEALAGLEQGLARNPNDPALMMARSFILGEGGKHGQEAVAALVTAMAVEGHRARRKSTTRVDLDREVGNFWENFKNDVANLGLGTKLQVGGVPPLFTLFVFFCCVCLAEWAFWFFADPDKVRQRRLKKRLRFVDSLKDAAIQGSLLMTEKVTGMSRFNKILEKVKRLEALQTLLMQADVNWGMGTFFLICAISGTVGLALGWFKLGFQAGLICAVVGFWLPYKFLKMKKKRRLKKFEKQLPEALDLLARGLKAGHAFASGMQMVSAEMPNPIGLEFFKTFKEYSHGMDLNQALLNLCERVQLRDLRFFTTAVMIQRETGGNLTEILEKISTLIRERFKLRNQIKALTGEGRLSGLVLIALPPVMALIIYKLNPDYMVLLIRHPWGRMMSVTALVMQLLGMLTIRKIVNIKV